MEKFILSIDEGTTGSTAQLTNAETLEVIGSVNKEFTQYFPKPSWVEHDLEEIWACIKSTTEDVFKKYDVSPKQVMAIGITNQRETTCAFNKKGEPLARAIVWQDRRTGEFCKKMNSSFEKFKTKTGLPLDPYFSATKMNWLLSNNQNVGQAALDNDLNFSTIDSFILYKMSSGVSFKTEASNASRTLLMDLKTCDWDQELLDFFELKKDYLPEINDSFGNFGITKGLDFLPDGIPIACMLGDQQSALFGQAGYKAGDIKCTYGTGAFILLNTGEKVTPSSQGLLTTVAYKHNGRATYATEGSSYIAGAAVQWLRDNIGLIKDSSQVEELALQVTDTDEMEHLLFMPFFTGIGSPHWVSDAKAAIVGLTRDTSKAHMARACLEGIALSINDSIVEILKSSPTEVSEIKVDGGAAKNDFLLQLQANFSQMKITRPSVIETTAYGVALGALIGTGKINLNQLDNLWKLDKSFTSEKNEYFSKKSSQWTQTVKRLYLD